MTIDLWPCTASTTHNHGRSDLWKKWGSVEKGGTNGHWLVQCHQSVFGCWQPVNSSLMEIVQSIKFLGLHGETSCETLTPQSKKSQQCLYYTNTHYIYSVQYTTTPLCTFILIYCLYYIKQCQLQCCFMLLLHMLRNVLSVESEHVETLFSNLYNHLKWMENVLQQRLISSNLAGEVNEDDH